MAMNGNYFRERHVLLEEKRKIEKTILSNKSLLEEYVKDVQQVELFGMERSDYKQKKSLCVGLILELRKLNASLNTVEEKIKILERKWKNENSIN